MSIKKTGKVFIYAAALLLTFPVTTFAGGESGLYIGAGVGDASVEEGDFDESDTGYKAFVGYNFGVIPLVDLAVEASYVDFGSQSSGPFNIEATGVNVFGLAGLSFGPFGIFAKAGTISWDADFSAGPASGSASGTDPAYGVGARLALGSFAVRAEYEVYDLDTTDVEMISVSGVYTF